MGHRRLPHPGVRLLAKLGGCFVREGTRNVAEIHLAARELGDEDFPESFLKVIRTAFISLPARRGGLFYAHRKEVPMAGRVYTATSNLVPYTGTSATPVVAGSAATTMTMDIQAIRIGIYSGGGVSYPSNGAVLCQLSRSPVPSPAVRR